jgi:dephospho-CoA kinase
MIIGLSGYAQAGKDTIANYLVSNYGYKKISFADPIREALYRLNPKVSIADMSGIYLRSLVDSLGWEAVKVESEDVRELLQRMGTEVARDMFGEDFWVDQAMAKAQHYENVVLADVRFENEIQAILGASGDVWRVSKPGVNAANRHISETSLDNYKFKREIQNLGSIEELHRIVDYFIKN